MFEVDRCLLFAFGADARVCRCAIARPCGGRSAFPARPRSHGSPRCAEALPSFVESQRLDPAAGTLMNIATCEEKVGRLASAWQHWREAIDALATTDDRVAFARNRVQALERKLPRLAVTLTSGRDRGARVFRDGVELGPASQGVPLPVDTGPHAITVRMPGHRVEQTAVRVGEGEQKRIEVQPGAVEEQAVRIGKQSRLLAPNVRLDDDGRGRCWA